MGRLGVTLKYLEHDETKLYNSVGRLADGRMRRKRRHHVADTAGGRDPFLGINCRSQSPDLL